MRANNAVEALAALAQEHRLALFRLLVQAGEKGMAAGAIADALGVPNSSLSFHLAARLSVRLRTLLLVPRPPKAPLIMCARPDQAIVLLLFAHVG